MEISIHYVAVEKVADPVTEGEFKVVEVQDNFIYKGRIIKVPQGVPVYLGNRQLGPGDVVWFAKYSPDTHEVDWEGKKIKLVKITDLLLVQ